MLTACAGWQLEAAAEDPVSGELSLRLADLFRLRLNISRVGAAASVEMLPGGWQAVCALGQAGEGVCAGRLVAG